MSYILDALRKAEQQRKSHDATASLSPLPATSPPSRRFTNLQLGVSAGLLVLGVLIGAMQPWKWGRGATTSIPASKMATRTTVPDLAGAPGPIPTLSHVAVEPLPENMPPENPQPKVKNREAERPRIEAAQTIPKPLEDVSTKRLPRPNMQEGTFLPGGANLIVSFHAWSPDPSARRVMINNLMLRQGDAIPQVGIVEEITQDGVVINNHGERYFRKN